MGRKGCLKTKIKFPNKYYWLKIQHCDHLKITCASNVPSKSLGMLGEEINTRQTIKTPERMCLPNERPISADDCPAYVAYILVYVTHA